MNLKQTTVITLPLRNIRKPRPGNLRLHGVHVDAHVDPVWVPGIRESVELHRHEGILLLGGIEDVAAVDEAEAVAEGGVVGEDDEGESGGEVGEGCGGLIPEAQELVARNASEAVVVGGGDVDFGTQREGFFLKVHVAFLEALEVEGEWVCRRDCYY